MCAISIDGVFKMLGLESEADRDKYNAFSATAASHTIVTTTQLKVTSYDFERKDSGDAELE